jgi:calcium-dependent protein kinase
VSEVEFLNKLDHPNIVKYFETYNDLKYIYLVMELVQGQQLFDWICGQAKSSFDENKARTYMK